MPKWAGYAVRPTYRLYQWYRNRGASNTSNSQEFEETQRARRQREETVSQYATQSNLHLHYNANEIVARFKEQQNHLGISIRAFDQNLEHIQRTHSSFDETGRALHYTVIEPMRILIDRIKAQFEQSSNLLSTLSDAFTHATQSVVDRERELSGIITNLSETEQSLRGVRLQAEYVRRCEEKIRTLEDALKDLTRKAKKLFELNKRQEQLIDRLQNSEEDSAPATHDFRLFGGTTTRDEQLLDYEEQQDSAIFVNKEASREVIVNA